MINVGNGGKAVVSVVDGLKSNPLVLGLVIMNFLFITITSYWIYLIGQSTLRKDALLIELVKNCGIKG